jgi:hypothetical protein
MISVACSHPLEVKNFHTYSRPAQYVKLEPPPKVAVLPFSGTPDSAFYFNTLLDRLNRNPSIDEIRTDWARPRGTRFEPDLVLSINPNVLYRSSGWNFVKNFPGFLVWAPAAAGYTYRADIVTDVVFYDAEGNELARKQIPISYDIRQAEFDRTAIAEISWFEVGLFALIGGIYNANTFDRDIIVPLQLQVKDNYANYVQTELQGILGGVVADLNRKRSMEREMPVEGVEEPIEREITIKVEEARPPSGLPA